MRLYVGKMLVTSFCAVGISVIRSKVEHSMEGRGHFAREPIEKQLGIGRYKSTPMFICFLGDKDVGRRYEEAVIFVSIKEILTYVLHFCNDLKVSSEKSGVKEF